jgi:hypothetical protein
MCKFEGGLKIKSHNLNTETVIAGTKRYPGDNGMTKIGTKSNCMAK